MTLAYSCSRDVEFNHVDAAGIVFYPRYFEMINSVIENFFKTVIGYSFSDMHLDQKKGVPTARFEVDFHGPSRLGDQLDFDLTVAGVGTSSLSVEIQCRCNNSGRMTVKQVMVFIDLETGKSEPWPQMIKQKLEALKND